MKEKLPDIKDKSTKEKINAFINCIEDERKLKRIYKFIKYIFFRNI